MTCPRLPLKSSERPRRLPWRSEGTTLTVDAAPVLTEGVIGLGLAGATANVQALALQTEGVVIYRLER